MIDSISVGLTSAGSTSAPSALPASLSVLATPLKSWPVADRHVERHAGVAEHVLDAAQQAREIDIVGVHLVDDDHPAQPALPASWNMRRVFTPMPDGR